MSRKVLLIGHCVPDTSRITRVLDKIGLEYASAHAVHDGVEMLREDSYALALPNRVIDGNEEGGVNFIKSIKAEEDLKDVPAMLISGIPAAQKEAEDAGAAHGFGKDELETGGAEKKIRSLLDL